MPTRIPLILIIALATALIAAGCGGDDDEDTTTTPTEETTATGETGATGAADVPPERAELVEEANAVCAEGNDDIDAAAQKQFGDSQQEPPAAEQEAFFTDTVLPSVQDQIDEIRALETDAPEEDVDELNGILDEAESVVDDLEQDPSALSEGADPFADVNQQLDEFGLTECAGG